MWQSAHKSNIHNSGNDCHDPGRDRCDDWNRGHGGGERHHGGGWGDPNCHDGGSWGGQDCHDGGSWSGQDCHDGGRLINFDHSFLICH